ETQGPAGAPPRPSTPFPDAYGLRTPQTPPQRPSAFGPGPAPPAPPPSLSSDVSKKGKTREEKVSGRKLVTIIVLLMLVGGGTGAFLYRDWLGQYFTPSASTQPYQTYQNSSLGVTLDYTQGWSVNVDQAHSTVKFADSSHTGQMNLSMTAASGQ